MADIWLDVDTALTEVPVNKVPLVASSDGFTIDETIAYNEAGMDLNWNFVTSAGVFTQTNVVPTTAGVHDWTHQGNGMYTIEIPASAGTINNDTEGYGWFSGFATGVVPFTSPIYGFRAAAINDALCDGGDLLDVNTTQIAGTAQTANDNGADINLILADTDILQQEWANGGRLDNLLDAVALEATVAALNDLSAAQVNAEVVDAVGTDTLAEMSQGAPPLAPTMRQALNYLYRELVRNKVVVDTNTANQKQVFADDGSTILYEKDLTNASNITTVAEATTGA